MESKIQTWTWMALALLVLAATAGRWVSAEHLANPRYNTSKRFSGDEVVYIVLGDRIWKEGRYDTRGLVDQLPLDHNRVQIPDYLDAPLFKHPPLFPFLVGLSRFLFWGVQGSSIYPSLLMGAISLLAIFWLAIELRCTPTQGLLAVLLLAVSPVHWICSSRIWLDMTLMTFILLAAAAQVRALRVPVWWKWSGFFWGCALLTKYTAFAAWAMALGAALLLCPDLRRSRNFWMGVVISVVMFLPWVAARFWFEGMTVVTFWRSSVEDWGALSGMIRWIWVLPLLAGAAWMWLRFSDREEWKRWTGSTQLLAIGTLAFIGIYFAARETFTFGTVPWSGFGPNELRNSPRDFYLTHQILFEPVCWWGLIGLATIRRQTGWDLVRAAWFGLFLFITLWGNFQSRYGLALVPFELVFAAIVLLPGSRNQTWGFGASRGLMYTLAAVWIVSSCVRSLWIINEIAIQNHFFYF